MDDGRGFGLGFGEDDGADEELGDGVGVGDLQSAGMTHKPARASEGASSARVVHAAVAAIAIRLPIS